MSALHGNPLFGALDPSEIIFTLIDDDIESMYWWRSMESSNAGSRRTPSTAQKLNMPITGGFTHLLKKGCLFFSDKLAIIGNLINYPYRIDTKAATRKHLSLSACVIAMALYNGDLSPLFCQREIAENIQRAREKLGDDSVNKHEIYVSATKENIEAVWSPRLSRIGMLTREQEGKSWNQVPFGQEASYFWFR
ncbi:hypothetical protein AAE478_007712 [Parahypoxylon ruwenzoriense]